MPYADEFRKLSERFQSIDADDAPTGQRHVERIASAAAKCIKRAADDGAIAIGIEGQWWPSHDARNQDDTPAWYPAWGFVSRYIATTNPDRLPTDVSLTVETNRRVGDGVVRSLRTERGAEFRQRAAEYADVCNLLAELTDAAGSLHDDEVLILKCLRKAKPRRLRIRDVASKTTIGNKRAGDLLTHLIALKYAERPKGERGGVTISARGEAVLDGLTTP